MNELKNTKVKGKQVAFRDLIIRHHWGKLKSPFRGVIALLLLIVLTVISLLIPCPTQFQYFILRAAFALSFTVFLSSFLGEITWKHLDLRPLFVSLFLLLSYFLNPAVFVQMGKCDHFSIIEGRILLGERPLKGATVSLINHDEKTISNSKGRFYLRWEKSIESSDSITLQVKAKGVDTSFRWLKTIEPVQLELADTILPLTTAIIDQLLKDRIDGFEQELKGKLLEFRVEQPISFLSIRDSYLAFEGHIGGKRNEYYFEGLDHKQKFKINLQKEGIKEVESLSPLQKHQLNKSEFYLLSENSFPNYFLSYLLKNQSKLDFQKGKLRFISDDHYLLPVYFEENIRLLKVDLQCSAVTQGRKVRKMYFYGFLPSETYEFRFRGGQWRITKQIIKK